MTLFVVDGLAWSGREQVASLLARALRASHVGPEQVARLAQLKGFDYDEFLDRLERPFGRLERFLGLMGRAMVLSAGMQMASPDIATPYNAGYHWDEYAQEGGIDPLNPVPEPVTLERLRQVLPQILRESVGSGHTVVEGCGAQAVFTEGDVLRVFLTSPDEVRASRAALEMEASPEEALRVARRVDRDRAGFARQVFRFTWDDPRNYDLVLDTSALEVWDVVELVLKTASVHAPLQQLAEDEFAGMGG